MTTPPDWYAADKAYQHHHLSCATCRAAGLAPGLRARCAEGAELWAAYQQAGDPPHFTWIARAARLKARADALRN